LRHRRRLVLTIVSGTLRDLTHAPIRGAAAAVVAFVDRTGRRLTADVRGDGAYALHALAAGTYWVTASADGYQSREQTVEVRPNTGGMLMDFTLQPAVRLSVRVTTPDGKCLDTAIAARGLVAVATREPPRAGKRCRCR
jgi:hypothetical protein